MIRKKKVCSSGSRAGRGKDKPGKKKITVFTFPNEKKYPDP